MKKSNLFLILSKLDKKELRELRKWLQSPAHNQREDVILLFEFLTDHLSPKKIDLSKEMAFPLVYPSLTTYDDGKMRQSIHFLSKSLEDFLVFRELQHDVVSAKTTLARVLRKKGLDKGFQKSIQIAHEVQATKPIRNTQYHQNDYAIRQEENRFAGANGRVKGFDFQGLSDSLDHMFISSKLREACTMISYQNVTKTEYNTGLLDYTLNYIADNPEVLNIPAVGIYYFGFKCTIDNTDENSFQELKGQIFKNKDLFPLYELKDLYLIAINFCLRRANSGDASYLRESFELYKYGVEEKILLENNYLSRFTFLNIVTNGARLGELEWLNTFIESKASLLSPENRDNIVHYCRSKLFFEKGNYAEAMSLLSQIEYDDILMNLSGKGMLLRIFYEEGSLNSLESLLESMRAYVQRKKVIGYHKSSFSNLIRFTRKLMKVNPYDQKEVQKLKAQIETANPLPEKDWLLKQIQKL